MLILNNKRLKEYTIPTILRVARKSDADRFNKRTGYSDYKLLSVDMDKLYNTDNLVMEFRVGDYITTLEIIDFLVVLDGFMNSGIQLPSALDKAFNWSMKTADVTLDCTCPDFKYRYAYVATQKDYKFGAGETRPAKKTNPKNKGRACKHILSVLNRPSNFKSQVSKLLMTALRDRYDLSRYGFR